MEKDIYKVISDIDSYIKLNKLYLDKDSHGSGKFDFHDIYSNQHGCYSPYFVVYEKLIKSLKHIGLEFESKTCYKSGNISTDMGKYFLMSNYGSEDYYGDNFLHNGIYFYTGFISDRGHLVVATYSKNFSPRIYEGSFMPMKLEGKAPFILSESLADKRPFYFLPEGQEKDYSLLLKINSGQYKKNNFQFFLKSNSHIKYEKDNSEYLSLFMSAKDDFAWPVISSCIQRLSTDYFNDTDMNILNRADVVSYLVKHTQRVEREINSLKASEKDKILDIFKEKAEYMNLLPQSINLNYKEIYKHYKVQSNYDDDYGAQRLNQLFTFINLQLSLKNDDKKNTKRLKI